MRRIVRRTLIRALRAKPEDLAGADRRVSILLVRAWGMGGTIRATLNLSGALARNGYDVEILSLFSGGDDPFFGEFPPGVRVTSLDDRPRGTTSAPRRLVRRILSRFPSTLMHPADRMAGRCTLWTDLMLVRHLRHRAGFVIGTRAMLNFFASELSRPGLVTIGQEHMNLQRKRKDLIPPTVASYPDLDAVAVLTGSDLRGYGELLSDRPKIVRIANGVRELPGPLSSLDRPTVLAAGRLTNQKGFDLLIPAFGQVVKDHPEWRLRICGRGPMRSKLANQIAKLGLGDMVELAGPVKDMGAEMSSASLFVLSSRWEGFPLALLEAMSKGLGVVAADCPTGPSDVIEDHRNGILVPMEDVDALATAIRELIEDEALRRACASAAVETAAAYSMPAIAAQWQALFRELWAAQGAVL